MNKREGGKERKKKGLFEKMLTKQTYLYLEVGFIKLAPLTFFAFKSHSGEGRQEELYELKYD